MSIRSILCAYSGEAADDGGLQQALKLAENHDAWLTGVLRRGRPVLERRFAAQLPDTLIDQLQRADEELVNEVSMRFTEMARSAGREDRSEFIDFPPESGGSISEFARNFDLVVTGAQSEDYWNEHTSANPDLIALRSGRPVLVVPNDYEADGLIDHALVAWDGKRSAARALGDAMSILEPESRVTVLTVGNEPVKDKAYLLRNLERHGISATYRVRHRQGSIAETVLKVAAEVSAKLLVMGAFEHSKFAHTILGGVTTDVMRTADIPVFLSH